jgi:threonine aldolase
LERVDDFNDMFADEEVKMVFFGGGEGGNELLPYIDFDNIASHPKLVCSFSDGTTILNAIYAKTGLITYYGQAPGVFSDLRYYDYMQFSSHFLDGNVKEFTSNSKWQSIYKGDCKGILIGGYTRNFALLTGSPYFSYDHKEKYLLFLEDHERFCKLDEVSSYISHIEQSEFIKNVAGLLFGHYSTTVYPELFQRLERFGKKYNIPVHLDGARLFNAALSLGVDAKDIAGYTDSVMFCLSKGLCAPVGSIVAGSKQFIHNAAKSRKLMGGGMRQSGILAAAGIIALSKMVNRPHEDHENAKLLAKGLSGIPGINVLMDKVQIDMVFLDVTGTGVPDNVIVKYMYDKGIKILPSEDGLMRLVTNKDVTRDDVIYAIECMKRVCSTKGHVS